MTPYGLGVTTMRVKNMGLAVDDSGKSLEANFFKLMAGRADVALGLSVDGDNLLVRPEFAGKIERLPLPFSEDLMYFSVTKPFYQANRAAVERMWDAIGRLRAGAAAEIQVSPPKR